MRYLSYAFPERASYPICILVPLIQSKEIADAYIESHGLDRNDVIVLTLHQSTDKKKTPVAEMKEYITQELVPIWEDLQVEYILCADGEYFKAIAGVAKADAHLGYVLDTEFHTAKVLYVPSHRAIFYDPEKVRAKIKQAMVALIDHRSGRYSTPGDSIIKFAEYPVASEDIQRWLLKFLEEGTELACDIEGFDLKHAKCGIGTISMAWSEHEGIAFPVDLGPEPQLVRAMLKAFFEQHQAKIIWHHIAFDVYVLIYQLFMDHILDTEGLLYGLGVMLRNWHCTKLISYLATNSCAGNKLSLKDLAQEFAGNWAVENIKDIRLIPLDQLLQYNLVDSLSTWHVFKKHWPTVIADNQLDTYNELFHPATVDIIQMQLTGLPVNMKRVKEVRKILEAVEARAVTTIQNSPLVQQFTYQLREKHVQKRNSEMVKKRITMQDAEVGEVIYNPNSGPQMQGLLYGMLGLPVISLTDSKQPSTDNDTLKALRNHTKDPAVIQLLDAHLDYGSVNKILTSFIPAMENAELGNDGWHYLFGNFNLGGTLSGRLSSSGPNLQNLPSNATMVIAQVLIDFFGATLAPYVKKGVLHLGKLIKSCFEAPPGWVFVGLDYSSLEDRISALTTKDPNKLKVYTDGYDGHCLRAYAYFPERCPGIDPNSVQSINSIAKLFPGPRQDSKIPTFALTYDGTFRTLMTGSGLPMALAKLIYARYHELYAVSDAWVAAKLAQAAKDGYITVAFGLRVRTPLLKQTIRGTKKTPYEAEAEGRSAGNALGQSWCLLNSRSSSEFMGKVRSSEHRLDIRPCAQIHDAAYFMIRDNIKPIMFTNEHLVKAVEWQEHPDIQHDEVKLGGELSIFWPTWANEIGIPNHANKNEIIDIIEAVINPVIPATAEPMKAKAA